MGSKLNKLLPFKTSFEFAYRDAAGVTDPSPVLYQLAWQEPLPLTLTNFTVVRKGEDTLLNWTTISEHNSEGFEIQHSVDRRNWTVLRKIQAKGESQAPAFYEYVHTDPQIGENLYRLKNFQPCNKPFTAPLISGYKKV